MAQLIAERIAARDDRVARGGAGLQRFIAGWAALGITLSGATQLRMAGLPVGPSELILAAWILFVAFLLLRGVKFAPTRVFVIVGAYWLGALMLLGLGALVAVQTRRAELGVMIRDGMAFSYIATLTTFLTLRLCDRDMYEYHWNLARLIFWFHALAAGLLLGLAQANAQFGPLDLWWAGIRFRGWAENPNQMALAMAAMPFLGWWLLRRIPSRLGKAVCVLGIALCVAAGLATLGDGLRLAWGVSLGVIGWLLFYRVTMRGRSRWLYVSHVIIPALLFVAAVFFGDDLVRYFSGVAESTYADRDQGAKRFTLWFHGLEVIRFSPLFGFGPGPFSGHGGPFEGSEAHNSFIDWGMSTGLVGILLYVALLGWSGWRALRSGEPMLVGMWMSVTVFSTFGYVLRQPDFWTVLVLVLILSERASALRERQARQVALEPRSHGWPSSRSVRRSTEHISAP